MKLVNYIQLVKDQISFFESKIKKHPSDSRVQAAFWQLKYKFELLLEYLDNKNKQTKTKDLSKVIGGKARAKKLTPDNICFVHLNNKQEQDE